jgi:hypothetical protein
LVITIPALASTVPGTASTWLAGQPSGTTTTGYFGSDTAPTNSPLGFTISGTLVTFTASGSTSVDGSCFAGANGGCYANQSSDSPAPWSADYNGPADALVGMFTNGAPAMTTVGGYTGPVLTTGPDYSVWTDPSTGVATIPAGTYSPALDQIFLIGSGAGEIFNVPTGATGLYLGVADSVGGSNNNVGSLTVNASFSSTSTTPEPGTLTLLGTGALGLLGMVRRRLA